MRISRPIHENDPTPTGSDRKIERMERNCTAARVVRRSPCGKGCVSHLIDRDLGTLGLRALFRARMCDRSRAIKKPRGFHGIRHITASFFAQGVRRAPVMFSLRERQSKLVLHDSRDLFATCKIVG